uniref:Odorant receptor n=1 Tax=Meteorus pulchricornis TaxID=51522 RepID=A0A1S5VFR1_9HYME|nr:olfactory receptor 74 [Meteorus pulchricornis]
MMLSVTSQTALNFTEMSVYFVSSWPPTKFVNKQQKLWFNFRWWLAFTLLLLFLLPLLNGVYVHHKHPVKMINAACLSAATVQALLKMLICRAQWPRLQMLHSEMDKFIKNADDLENKYIRKYIERGYIFHGFVTSSMYLVSLVFIIEPALQSHQFPTDSVYPFRIQHEAIHIALYTQQIVALFLVAAALSVDFQVAILLWFIGIKFEILGDLCERVSTNLELDKCIIEHQRILWYADQVQRAVCFITFSAVATTTLGVVCGCLALLGNLPLAVKFRVANIVGNAATEIFIYAWPGDNIITVSQEIGWKIYNCNWLAGSPKMVKNVMSIIQRAQHPVTISISGFIPSLSLQYYTSFLSTTFSYFTTLRIILSAAG